MSEVAEADLVSIDLGEDAVRVCLQEVGLFKEAMGEELTYAEMEAQCKFNVTPKERQWKVERIKSVIQQQKTAGSAKDREAALDLLGELRASVPKKLDELDDEIRALETQKADLRNQLDAAERQVNAHKQAVQSLITAIERETIPHVSNKITMRQANVRSVLYSLSEKRGSLERLSNFVGAKFGSVHAGESRIGPTGLCNNVNEWMRANGLDTRKLYDECVHDNQAAIRPDLQAIEATKAILRPIIEKLKAEIEPRAAQVERANAEIEKLRNYLVPQ